MICLDTSFLIELWRHRDASEHRAVRTVARHAADVLVVPVPAAGGLDRDTAVCYAELAAYEAAVLTDNPRHFRRFAGLEVLELAR